MPRLFVVDTNGVVSGVVGRNDASPPVLLLNAMVTGRLPFVVSADLIAEYRRVLTRSRIAARHGRPSSKVDALLAQLTMTAYLRQPPDDDAPNADDPPPDSPPGDEHIIRLLAHEPRAALVSGDQVLLDAVRGWREVLTSAELVALLGLTPPAV
jgi:uncharacterized protein